MSRFRYLAKSVVHGAFDVCGLPHRKRKALCDRLIILTYHSFCAKPSRSLFSSLPIDRFEQHVRFLKKNFKLVSLEQGLQKLKQGWPDHKPLIAITIDDGFRDNYTLAWPILQRYGTPATIFLTTDFIDNGRAPWPTQIAEILERTTVPRMDYPFADTLGELPARSLIVSRLKKKWSSLSPENRFKEIDALRRELEVFGPSQHAPLSWEQVREMRSSGVRFGSHTVFHSILPTVSDSLVRMEISESKKRIEDELQECCLDFAYPNGDYGSREIDLLQAENYRLALSQDLGANDSECDALSMSRIEVPSHDPFVTFRVRVSCCLF